MVGSSMILPLVPFTRRGWARPGSPLDHPRRVFARTARERAESDVSPIVRAAPAILLGLAL